MLETQPPNRFSIFHQGLARGAAYEAWREGICRGFCRLDVGPAEDDYIDCHNEFVLLDSVAIATPVGRSARFARTRDLLDRKSTRLNSSHALTSRMPSSA